MPDGRAGPTRVRSISDGSVPDRRARERFHAVADREEPDRRCASKLELRARWSTVKDLNVARRRDRGQFAVVRNLIVPFSRRKVPLPANVEEPERWIAQIRRIVVDSSAGGAGARVLRDPLRNTRTCLRERTTRRRGTRRAVETV